ncbi:hypothetical protein D5S17_32850 [Pseudonocardiaceae bacterium YIM PH 21723]|nr:hypothetical protein D5S17_32850 [Pseudonocardiaceae bacterium YIM PH 21723]
MLDDLPGLYATSSQDWTRQKLRQSIDGTRAPGYRSTSPANDDAIVLCDPRSTTGPDGIPWPPVMVLALANRIRAEIGQDVEPRPALASDCAYLIGWLDRYLLRQQWVAEVWQQVRRAYRTMRYLALLPDEDKPAGPCMGTVRGVPCDGQVFVEYRDNVPKAYRCGTCSRPYSGMDLLRLQQSWVVAS